MKYLSAQKKWNGWGLKGKSYPTENLRSDFYNLLQNLLEIKHMEIRIPAKKEDFKIPASIFSQAEIKEFQSIVTKNRFTIENDVRLMHARGRSFPDLLALRRGSIDTFPDAVIYPVSESEVSAVLALAARKKIAVIPYGGGSSVVGGINALKLKSQKGILVVNMERMNRQISMDHFSMSTTFECGISGPDLEAILNKQGYTIGHFPQSFEFSTLGGWIAARGSGYFSGVYGKAEDMLLSCSVIAPNGKIETENFPASSQGPCLNQIIAGSEGTLGIITQATLKIHKKEHNLVYKALLFPDYPAALAALRRFKQSGVTLHMARLSDPEETNYFSMMSKSSGNKKARLISFLQNSILRFSGYKQPSVMLTVGGPDQYKKIKALQKTSGKSKMLKYLSLGKKPVADWFLNRYEFPYLRDELLDHGIGAETFETSMTWSNLEKLRSEIYKTVEKLQKTDGLKCILMSHISHSYKTGAAIYFTILYRLADNPLEQWKIIKKNVTDTIVKHKGSLSHHHGIGADHRPWLIDKMGKTEYELLQSIKKQLDPSTIMNPGKLF